MQFTIHSVFFVLLALFSTAWSTMALPVLQSREVFDPPITFPTAGAVFKAGQNITVTWDTSSLPAGTPNEGQLVLGRFTPESEHLDVENPLATGFLLTDGSHVITLPTNLPTQSNYILDLFGDSGNISPQFTIESLY